MLPMKISSGSRIEKRSHFKTKKRGNLKKSHRYQATMVSESELSSFTSEDEDNAFDTDTEICHIFKEIISMTSSSQ